MNAVELIGWLIERDPEKLQELWTRADEVRRAQVGDQVHLRGLVEISNHCRRSCSYCGIRGPNRAVRRFRMWADEVVAAARNVEREGLGSVVLQAGEDPALTLEWVRDLVRALKVETRLAVTLSLGERSSEELRAWREAGADRYLLRFETSNAAVYRRIHPPIHRGERDRLAQLQEMRRLGFELGSGVMVGIPGTSWEDLANDLLSFQRLGLDMIGVGPYIPAAGTPLAASAPLGPDAQVPNDVLTTYKVIALARLLCPRANIPATTALATLGGLRARVLGLSRGANICMPNMTPVEYRRLYRLYPGNAPEANEVPGHSPLDEIRRAIVQMGRSIGQGRGDSPAYLATLNGGASC